MAEIKDFTMLQVNLFIQRHNEPFYKERIEHEINKPAATNYNSLRGSSGRF
jgi:hypothetical protein